uniref:HERV-H LTR-associating 2a, tandem duplicate 2 n=1 Tax=Salarias fasciatus TaxID=181472 RepID=A0A672GZT2_SALFA
TCLFNSHIPHGNASLLLRRVKVQDKGRYKCYTSTRKGNKEMFVNLEAKGQYSATSCELVTCSSQNIYPVPHVTWATDPPSAQEVLENSTIKTTDHKGLYTVESVLRMLGNLSNHTYFCSFISADKTQVWTASWKNQEAITQEEGHALSVPCIAPHNVQNFSLVWTFSSSSEPTVIIKYDNRTRHTHNLWESQAALDPDLLLLGDGSLLLHRPDVEQHSGTYTCTFSGLQSRHIVQTKVNITVASIPSHRYNGTALIELHKEPNMACSYIIEQLSSESIRQPPESDEHEAVHECGVTSSADTQTIDPPDEETDGLESSGVEKDVSENTDPGHYLPEM